MSFDLDAYLARIGHAGPRAADLATLRALHRLHPATIAFENLDPYLRRPVALDAASLQAKLVHGGRGGWCFEQNLLLRHALVALGFRATGLAARVIWNKPEDSIVPRTHMLLAVDVEGPEGGRWLADVGFGGMVLTAPVRLVPDVAQPTPHGAFRLRRDGELWTMQAELPDGWRSLYRFDLTPQEQVDYELASWFLCTHPSSHFLAGIIAARSPHGVRHALRGRELAVHPVGGETERRALRDGAELRAVLEDVFGLRVPSGAEVDAALARAVAG
jgi:N-hydroxyarylamine O-acetyltransferase